MGVPSCIIHLLEDTTVPKIGLSLGDDMNMLHHRVKFSPGRFIDLQKMVSDFGIKDLSLQKLYANIFHERISKREPAFQLGERPAQPQAAALRRHRRLDLHQPL